MRPDAPRSRAYDLVGFGIAAVDDVVQMAKFPEPDTKVPITRIERHAGGQCTTALVAAARQGLRCAYAGVLGRNELSEFTRNALQNERVEMLSEIRYPGAKPYYSIILLDGSTGERTILYSGDGVRGPEPEDISEELIANSHALLVDQLGPAGTLRACNLARKRRTQTIGDFERADDERLREAMLRTDHLIIPLRLARQVTGCEDPEEAVSKLAYPGRECTAVTDGSRGCWFVAGSGGVIHQPSFPLDVVDTTGCGDVFHGAYAAAIVRGMPPDSAIRYAAAAAALNATQRGGQQGIPDRPAVERFLADPSSRYASKGARHDIGSSMPNTSVMKEALAAGDGIVRLAPCWVPRKSMVPGGRLRLDPRDIYALGAYRGGINERWFSSTTNADNGPDTPADEGLSYIVTNGKRVLLKDAMESIGDELLGADVMREQGGWNVLCKFFDNLGPIAHHLHQMDKHARLVGRKGKTEAHYFPPQYNPTVNSFPYTFMGLEPGTTRDDVRRCLERWDEGDNGILYHSRAYKLRLGTGWQIDTGILHAPGSLLTYEPQVNSDVFGTFQSMVEGRALPWDMLVKDVPPEYHHDLDFIIGMLDWDANIDPEFASHRLFHPKLLKDEPEMAEGGYCEKWVASPNDYFSAKELTVFPGRSAVIRDAAAYGLIVVQGFGSVGATDVATPSVIRYGEMTEDELFVTACAARQGVTVTNRGGRENLVMLKHFGPGNQDARGLTR